MGKSIKIKIVEDNRKEIIALLKDSSQNGLQEVGEKAVAYARQNIDDVPATSSWYTRTGNLKASIRHEETDNYVYIGTDCDYGQYVELGTGPYHDGGGGRTDVPWKYEFEGEWHLSYGMKPFHFLKRAFEEHQDEYQQILTEHLSTIGKVKQGFRKIFSFFKH